MPFLYFIFAIGLTALFTGCSNSRLMNSESILPAGNHQHGSIFTSDLLIPAGSSLNVAFSSENRFYVATGGRLTGFHRGGKSTRIYAEKGAELPDARSLKGLKITPVKNAAEAYRKRFEPLPPLKSSSSMSDSPSSVDGDDDWDDDFSLHRPAPSSVSPSSYQKKN